MTASNMDISESYIEPNNSGSFYLNSRFTVNGTVKEAITSQLKCLMPSTHMEIHVTTPTLEKNLKIAMAMLLL
ncbi:hypothetical protein ACO1DO_00375 [Staphylococcus aureus]